MSDTVSIDTLKMAQSDLGLCDYHLVHLGEQGFTIAHTDEERSEARGGGTPLDECDLHGWLNGLDGPPEDPGVYVALPHEVDAYSESYPVPRWDFYDAGDFAALHGTQRPTEEER